MSKIMRSDGSDVVVASNNVGWYQSQAFEEKKAVVAGAGCLAELYVVNKDSSTRYVWVFDAASATGTVLAGPFVLNSEAFISLDDEFGLPFSTGVYIASSTTLATYTASTTADLSISAKWGVSS